MQSAKNVFNQLQIARTTHKNGVLIYLAIKDKKFSTKFLVELQGIFMEFFWTQKYVNY